MIHWQIKEGFVVKVDKDLFHLIRGYKWTPMKSKKTSTVIYAKAIIRGKIVSMHRLIMDAQKGQIVDHIDGDGLNNTRSNLRFCTFSQNCMNRKKRRGSLNKYVGVYKYSTNKYYAVIEFSGFRKRLGTFESEEEAALAYNQAAIVYHGEFANLNKI